MAESFDYVIVGGGSAGCVLANRLSADPTSRVVLLEAGARDRDPRIHLPAAFPRLFETAADWSFTTEPDARSGDRRWYWPRGRVLGGSSSINAMLYVRGTPEDYDGWRDLGNPGWSWSDVLPVFRRLEDQARGESPFHGIGGPLRVEDPRSPSPLSRAFVQAGLELGFAENPDFNGPTQEGFGLYQVTQRRGRRCSAALAFLHPVRQRPNLTVQTGATALGLMLDGQRTLGVRALVEGSVVEYRADREVVLAAGAVQSPKILMLSGLGPARHLHGLGISVVADLPGVGRNLQDHVVASVVFAVERGHTLDDVERVPAVFGHLLRWMVTRRGPLTSSVCEAGAFVRRPDAEHPDLQLHFIPSAMIDHGFAHAAPYGINFGPTLLRPKSRGRITLGDDDPLRSPTIHAGYLGADEDVRVLIEGVRLARRLAATRALAGVVRAEAVPGPTVANDDAALERFVRDTAATIYHPVGTCRMGPEPHAPQPAVVDAQLRVHGIDGLRVVDASVMPRIVSGNTNAPTMMIADRAADFILGARAPGPTERTHP